MPQLPPKPAPATPPAASAPAPVATVTPIKPQEAAVPGKTPAEPAAKAPAAKPTAEQMRMLKLKVDGMAEEFDLPEAEVLKLAAYNAKALMNAKELADRLTKLEKRLKEDPEGLMAELGLDPDARAIERVNRKVQAQIDAETLTPEQKELRELKAEKEARAKKEQADAEAAKKVKAEETKRKYMDEFANVIAAALKETTLPQASKDETLFTVEMLAKELERSIKHKLFVNPTLLAKKTEETFRTAVKPVLAKMAAEHLADFIGPDTLKGLVKIYAQRQGLTAATAVATKKAPTASERRAAEKNATQDYFNGTRRAWRR